MLDLAHLSIELSLGLGGVLGHLGEEGLLHGGTGGLVVRKVACHMGADGGDVSTTAGNLLGNLGLNLVEENQKALSPIGSVRHEHASLFNIHRRDRGARSELTIRSEEHTSELQSP